MQKMTEDSLGLSAKLWVNICCCILDEALDQLFILQRLNQFPKMENQMDTSGAAIIKETIETMNKTVGERHKHNQATFEKNFEFIETTLKVTYEELRNKGTFEHLTEVIQKLKKSKMDIENLKEETKNKQSELQKLEYTLYEEEQIYHQKIVECMAEIGKIKDEIEDFLVEGEMKIEYIEKWQNSKAEMNNILLEGKEEEKMNALKKLDSEIYKEERVHHEILAAYKEMEQDIQNEIDKWEEKYRKDYDELAAKIQALKDKRDKQTEATKILRQTYIQRQREINDYKLYKIKEEEKKMELKKRHDAATKIQAWWRGTMVRKGFGKFRKKKDKKGKKKGQ